MKDELRILRLKGINGIYDELYKPNPTSINNKSVNISDGILDMGQYFWSELLSDSSLRKLIDVAKNNDTNPYLSPQILSAIADENLFFENVKKAKVFLCDQGLNQQEFFSYVETLSIVCSMYSQFIYNDIDLTINNGFLLDETSSRKLYINCCNPNKNPMFNWILDNIVPIILDYEPDIIFCDGKPSMSFFTIAKILKKKKLNCHISISRSSSEYYSLSKIRTYLTNNKYLFEVFDSIILDNFMDVEQQLIQSISKQESFYNIQNLIFKNDGGIQCTVDTLKNAKSSLHIEIHSRKKTSYDNFIISPDVIEDVHIMPSTKCYWNKCAFCGINKKYLFEDVDSDSIFMQNLTSLKDNIKNNDIEYIWFIDEALPPARLRMIAEYFLKEDIHVFWQARCRIEKALLDNELPQLLSLSGLRELRLGLESASLKVLKLMNKFPDGFSLSLVTDIVDTYQRHSISIHCPMIIGFPGETKEDRRTTYDYLSFLKTQYSDFTFNINILSIDVSSKIFEDWIKFNINKIELPCQPDEFLGNITNYDENQYAVLDKERDNFMKEKLYPWYPADALTKPHIFYRLCETIRNTLIWKSHSLSSPLDIKNTTVDTTLRLCDNVSYCKMTDDTTLVYNWNTHRYLKANHTFVELLFKCKKPQCITTIIEIAKRDLPDIDYIGIIKKLINYGFLVSHNKTVNVLSLQNTDNNIVNYFDEMYRTQMYDYVISENLWLKNNLSLIPKGKILDIGIGCGQNIDFILNSTTEYDIHGIDISPSAIRILQKKYPHQNCTFWCDDISHFDTGINMYNLIICSMMLHYLNFEEIQKTIKKMKQALKSDGYLYMSVLSKNDALYKCESSKLVKHFFSIDELFAFFDDMEIINISDSLYRDETRHLNAPYWGIIECVVKKRR